MNLTLKRACSARVEEVLHPVPRVARVRAVGRRGRAARCSRSPAPGPCCARLIAEERRRGRFRLSKMWRAVFWLKTFSTFSSSRMRLVPPDRRSCDDEQVGLREDGRAAEAAAAFHEQRDAVHAVDRGADGRAARRRRRRRRPGCRSAACRSRTASRRAGDRSRDARARSGCRASPTRARRGPTRGWRCCRAARCCRPAAASSPSCGSWWASRSRPSWRGRRSCRRGGCRRSWRSRTSCSRSASAARPRARRTAASASASRRPWSGRTAFIVVAMPSPGLTYL